MTTSIEFFMISLISNKNRMNKLKTTIHIKVGAILCALYVAFGAFGAHGLKPLLTPSQLNTYETGLRYMIIHCLALIVINLCYHTFKKYSKWPSFFIYSGVVLFSFSLMVHALRDIIGLEINVFAMLAPIGGLCFIAGWISFLSSIRKL